MIAVFREEEKQELLASFLPEHGFFVEVGALDPVELSQTLHLEQCGWDGLLIEPIPSHAGKLKGSRRARVVQAVCGSPLQYGQQLPIYVAGGRSSLRYAHGPVLYVPIVTLDSILSDSGVQREDFLSVDVEARKLMFLAACHSTDFDPH